MSGTILILAPVFPFPVNSGTRVDIASRVEFFLAEGYELVFVSCESGRHSASRPKRYAATHGELTHYTVRRNQRWSLREDKRLLREVRTIAERHAPFLVLTEYAELSAVAAALRSEGRALWFRSHNFEVVHFLEKTAARLLRPDWGHREFVKNWIKLLCGHTAFTLSKILLAERRMHRLADRILYISMHESTAMPRLYRADTAGSWIPPLMEVRPSRAHADGQALNVVLLSGNYADPIQRATVCELLENVIPAVRRSGQRVVFHIVGKGGDFLEAYRREDVVLHGFIDDLQTFLLSMDASCIPAPIGRGLKIKMLEAMSSGLPVVAHHHVFRSVPVGKGAYYACRDGLDYVEAFRQLREPARRHEISTTAAALAAKWERETRQQLAINLSAIRAVSDNRPGKDRLTALDR